MQGLLIINVTAVSITCPHLCLLLTHRRAGTAAFQGTRADMAHMASLKLRLLCLALSSTAKVMASMALVIHPAMAVTPTTKPTMQANNPLPDRLRPDCINFLPLHFPDALRGQLNRLPDVDVSCLLLCRTYGTSEPWNDCDVPPAIWRSSSTLPSGAMPSSHYCTAGGDCLT